jgi:uncharacterized protein (TIGR02118 family)
MHKLVLQFHQPRDLPEFENRWSNEFVAAAEAMPGVRRVALTRFLQCISGDERLYLTHEFFFDDAESALQALTSPQGQVAGKALMAFAADSTNVYLAEHLEETKSKEPTR